MNTRQWSCGALQWATGLFCSVIGVLMLITPHQFASPTFLPLQPALPLWGAAFLLAGGILLTVALLALRSLWFLLAHLFGGVMLLSLAYAFISTGAWTGTTNYLALGLTTLMAPLLGRPARLPVPARRDLLALGMGLAGLATGLVLLLFPAQWSAPLYDRVRFLLPWHGLAFVLGGLALLADLAFQPRAPWARPAAHLLGGGAFIAFGVVFALPNRGLTGMALYIGLGTILALLPWIASWVIRVDTGRLSTRLSMALVVIAALPLIVGTAVITGREEQAAVGLTLVRQRGLAVSLAANMDNAIAFERAIMTSLAVELAELPPDAEAQGRLLRRFQLSYPEFILFSSYDLDGETLSSSGAPPRQPVADDTTVFSATLRTRTLSMAVDTSPALELPVITMGVPVIDQQGELVGVATGRMETSRLATALDKATLLSDIEVYVVDRRGQVIVHPDPEVARGFENRADSPPVAALLSEGQAGDMGYQSPSGLQLAGYAPIADLGWGVVVEQPVSSVLAGVHAGRELALAVLALVLVAAFGISLLFARLLTVPLGALVMATRQMTSSGQAAEMPQSELREVAELAGTLTTLRDSLERRTSERDLAEARLRVLADAGSVLNASLDYDLTLTNLTDLLVPAVADWCSVYLVGEDGLELAVLAHVDPTRVAMGRELFQRYPPNLEDTSGLAQVLRSGRPELLGSISDEMIQAAAHDAEHLRLLRSVGFCSLMLVPLVAHGQILGALALVSAESGQVFTAEDLKLAEELARRAALALDNVRRYATERRLRAEAEMAVQMRETFLSIAAHELKTPLTPLLGQAELIERRAGRDSSLSERDRRAIQVIADQARRLSKLVTSLLDLNRLQSGRITLTMAPLDLAELAERIVDEQQPTLETHQLCLERPPEAVPIVGDALRLEQVLQNLVQNAVKYSPDGSQIKIYVAHDAAGAWFQVADAGIGIPPESMANLFAPFYRAANAERSMAAGLGVGLAVVREIVALHGGTVEVISTEGVGSTFTVRLPQRPELAGGPPSMAPPLSETFS